MIAGAGRVADAVRRGQGGKEHRPGRHVAGRRVERGHRRVAIEEAERRRIERVRIIGDIVDVIDAERGVGAIAVADPVDEARPGVALEGEGDRNAVIHRAVGAGIIVIDAVGGENDGTRIDQRAGADIAVGAIHDADAIHIGAIDDVGWRIIVVRHDGMSRRCDAQSGQSGRCQKGRTTGARQQARAILTNAHDVNSPKTVEEAMQLLDARQLPKNESFCHVSKKTQCSLCVMKL